MLAHFQRHDLLHIQVYIIFISKFRSSLIGIIRIIKKLVCSGTEARLAVAHLTINLLSLAAGDPFFNRIMYA
jgi:hypothetical protein